MANTTTTSKTTLQTPTKAKGMLLQFNEADFNDTKRAAEKIIPAIKEVMNAYSLLEIKTPFDDKQFEAFISGTGATETINSFKESVKKDLKVFSNPISRTETENKIDEYAARIHEPLRKVKAMLHDFNKSFGYKLGTKDFEVSQGDVDLKTEEMQKHYSIYLTTQLQIEGYTKLYELAEKYNSVVEFISKAGIQLPFRHNLVDFFFGPEVLSQDSFGTNYGPRIEIIKNNLTVFK